MSQFMFGVRRGKLTDDEKALRDRIAEKHGVDHEYIRDPGSGWLSWFSGPNRGDPFDRDLAAAVAADLETEVSR